MEESDILALNIGELKSYVNLVGLCKEYGDFLLVTFEEISEIDRERRKSRRIIQELKTQNDQLEKQNKVLFNALTEAQNYLSSVQSKKENKFPVEVLQELLNIYQGNNQSSGRTCQYDDNELRKTFYSKFENGKKAYKWECVPFRTHTYWIVE